MNAKRRALASLFGLAALALVAQPVAAGAADSTTESLIRGLNEQLMFVAVPITLLVEGILIFTVLKYRNNDEPKPTKENRRLEITWTVATAVILLFVGVAAYGVMGNPDVTASDNPDIGPDDEEINVDAYRYAWDFNYIGENVTTSSTGGQLVLPADTTVYLNVTSRDWLHAFHVPGLGLKQDAVPGKTNYLRTNVTEPGVYQGYCAEYCGEGHSKMMFEVRVLPKDEYQEWLEEQRGGSGNGSASVATAD